MVVPFEDPLHLSQSAVGVKLRAADYTRLSSPELFEEHIPLFVVLEQEWISVILTARGQQHTHRLQFCRSSRTRILPPTSQEPLLARADPPQNVPQQRPTRGN